MKKLISLLFAISMALSIISCGDESEDPKPTSQYSISDFTGWTFDSMVYGGKTWTDCGKATDGVTDYNGGAMNTISLNVNVTNKTLQIVDDCTGWTTYDFSLKFNGNLVDLYLFEDTYYTLEIIELTETMLKFKLTTSRVSNVPNGAIFTMIKI